jgi:glycosyltransferase involved in cell wall biosynthesis
VADGTTGFVVPPRDVGAVAAALDAVLSDAPRRAEMGAAARRRAETEFAYETLAAQLEPLARGDLSVLKPLGALRQ